MPNEQILVGCEVGCVTPESELVACPLSKEERENCKRRQRWEQVAFHYRTYKHELTDIEISEIVDGEASIE